MFLESAHEAFYPEELWKSLKCSRDAGLAVETGVRHCSEKKYVNVYRAFESYRWEKREKNIVKVEGKKLFRSAPRVQRLTYLTVVFLVSTRETHTEAGGGGRQGARGKGQCWASY